MRKAPKELVHKFAQRYPGSFTSADFLKGAPECLEMNMSCRLYNCIFKYYIRLFMSYHAPSFLHSNYTMSKLITLATNKTTR